jgi:hypothetical protein
MKAVIGTVIALALGSGIAHAAGKWSFEIAESFRTTAAEGAAAGWLSNKETGDLYFCVANFPAAEPTTQHPIYLTCTGPFDLPISERPVDIHSIVRFFPFQEINDPDFPTGKLLSFRRATAFFVLGSSKESLRACMSYFFNKQAVCSKAPTFKSLQQ